MAFRAIKQDLPPSAEKRKRRADRKLPTTDVLLSNTGSANTQGDTEAEPLALSSAMMMSPHSESTIALREDDERFNPDMLSIAGQMGIQLLKERDALKQQLASAEEEQSLLKDEVFFAL